ncbi:MAG: 1-acyl-sn-glycerol-3-phosphate acyltransferase [Candidatus Pelagisphaera sp.]|jgi:1-acyl-sn-glycerol-3-phosphate acyltransferase
MFMWFVYHGQRGNRWGTHRRALWQKRFAAHLLKVMHLSVKTRGMPPEGSFIAANHQGYMDILVMGSLTPQVFLSKHSVAEWPFIGTFVKMAGTLFIDRTRRREVSTQEDGFANAIEQKVGMTVYLEGTSTDGSYVLPFKSSLLDPVVRNQWDVTPAYLKYECEGGDPALDVCWWGDMTFGSHLLKMMTLKSIRATIVFGKTRNPGNDRKVLANELYADVLALRDVDHY